MWDLNKSERLNLIESWKFAMQASARKEMAKIWTQFSRTKERLKSLRQSEWVAVMKSKRIVGCTTNAAAKYAMELQMAEMSVLVVEEAGEVLEAHVLAALQPRTKQLIMIGDHQQLRPKVESHELEVACHSKSHNFNVSLFERLVTNSKLPRAFLEVQHRMRTEISDLIRTTYPALRDGPRTTLEHRPHVRGVAQDVLFLNHEDYEVHAADGDNKTKINTKEAARVVAIVKYLMQQGYEPDQVRAYAVRWAVARTQAETCKGRA